MDRRFYEFDQPDSSGTRERCCAPCDEQRSLSVASILLAAGETGSAPSSFANSELIAWAVAALATVGAILIWIRSRTIVPHLIEEETKQLRKRNADLETSLKKSIQNEATLQQTVDQTLDANRAKGDFIATISHEIRTPLNSLLGITELVLESDLEHQQRMYLETVLQSGRRLLTIINEVLDFSKIEAGKLELQFDKLAVRSSLNEVTKSFEQTAQSKSISLLCEVSEDVPEVLIGDADRLRQVLNNLVGNALKFTDNGHVRTRVQLRGKENGQAILQFTVDDTGIGIPSNELETIFEAFEQASQPTTAKNKGTGLGLSITSQLVHAMGGEIWAESQPGKGSQFHFTVAFGTQTETTRTLSDYPEITNVPVLVIDKNETDRLSVKGILAFWGASVYPVPQEGMAFRLLEDILRTSPKPPVLIVEAHDADAYVFRMLEKIQQVESIGTKRCIVMTTTPTPEIKSRCAELGITHLIQKPIVRPSLLLEAVLAIVTSSSDRSNIEPVTSNSQLAPVSNLKILLAEDGKANQILATGLLNKWDHEVTLVETGQDAVNAFQENNFDLILMDIQMPVMSGLEASLRIRELESGGNSRIPIVAMTARAMPEDRTMCLEAGMDDYVAKPINSQLLMEVIARLFAVEARPE